MSNKEFSEGFDTLTSAYFLNGSFGNSNEPPVFNEYEKSLFLTLAQEKLAISIYNGTFKGGEAFENTEEIRRYLSNNNNTKILQEINDSNALDIDSSLIITKYKLPDDVMFITYEEAKINSDGCLNNKVISVIPVSQDQLYKQARNPFRGPNDNRALRLDTSDNTVELVSKYKLSQYQIRYIKKLSPIVLEDLPNGLTINGFNKATECKLHESLHQQILGLAVTTALSTRSK